MTGFRIGQGFDAHRLVPDRKLIVAGVEVPFEKGLLGHSDADVVAHAVMDAVLGALAHGDIGELFPPDDPKYKDACSMDLARQVAKLASSNGYEIAQVDVTVIAQEPRLKEYVHEMRKNLAECFSAEVEDISVKATTTDRMGFIGKGEGMAALALAVLKKR
ncbi:MAG: 2-C-methyl-D-erythritol 2,4-cyclodiphosphate synthase [bacterium]